MGRGEKKVIWKMFTENDCNTFTDLEITLELI